MFNIDEVLRILRSKPDKKLIADIEEMAELMEDKISKRHIKAEFPVRTENGIVYISDIEIESKYLADLVSGMEKCTVMAATIGIEAEKFISFQSKISALGGLIADAIASAEAEGYCDEIAGAQSRRYSPGYGDFGLDNQKKILKLLNAEKNLGIYLTPENIMKPRKSITAIIINKPNIPKCSICKNCKIECNFKK